MIDTAALREKVLDLAIRGKLVPQDPTDEPASVLLERIHEQKLQMVREGKLKAKDVKDDTIIFKGDDNCYYEKFSDGTIKNIQDEIPFDLPYGWSWCRLKCICPYGECDNVECSEIKNDDWILDLEDIEKDSGKILAFAKKSDKNSISTKHKFYQGQLLYSKLRPYLNKVVIAPTAGYCTSEILPLLFWGDIDVHYMQMYLMSNVFLSYTDKISYGVKMPRLGTADGKQALIALPPNNEQKLIAKTFQDILPALETIKTEQCALEDIINLLKSKVLELAIQGKLVPQDENDEPANVLLERIRAERKAKLGKKYVESYIYKGDDNCYYEKVGNTSKKISEEMPFDLPFGWCWITLKEIATITSGKTPKNEQITDLGNIPYFKVGDMNLSGNEIFMEVVQYYVNDCYTGITFPKNSFIFPKNGGALLTNKKRILKQESLVDLNTGVLIPSSAVNNEFMFYLFSTVDFTKNYKGSTIPTIDNEMIGNIVFALPPIEEQSRIVQKIKAIMSILKGGD